MTEEDIPVMREIFDDDSTRKYLPELRLLVCNDEGIKRMLASFETLQKQDEGIIWGIRTNELLMGFVALVDMSCLPTIIYAMHPCYRLKGYMKECIKCVLHFLFSSFCLDYVQTEVHKGNECSIAILKSVGFREVSVDEDKIHLQQDTPYQAIRLCIKI